MKLLTTRVISAARVARKCLCCDLIISTFFRELVLIFTSRPRVVYDCHFVASVIQFLIAAHVFNHATTSCFAPSWSSLVAMEKWIKDHLVVLSCATCYISNLNTRFIKLQDSYLMMKKRRKHKCYKIKYSWRLSLMQKGQMTAQQMQNRQRMCSQPNVADPLDI